MIHAGRVRARNEYNKNSYADIPPERPTSSPRGAVTGHRRRSCAHARPRVRRRCRRRRRRRVIRREYVYVCVYVCVYVRACVRVTRMVTGRRPCLAYTAVRAGSVTTDAGISPSVSRSFSTCIFDIFSFSKIGRLHTLRVLAYFWKNPLQIFRLKPGGGRGSTRYGHSVMSVRFRPVSTIFNFVYRWIFYNFQISFYIFITLYTSSSHINNNYKYYNAWTIFQAWHYDYTLI